MLLYKNCQAIAVVLSVSVLLLVATGAQGVTIISHTGSNNPLAEGWTIKDSRPFDHVDTGPVFELGKEAWKIDDNGGSAGVYNYGLSPSELQQAKQFGWSLSTTLRVVDEYELWEGVPDSAVQVGLYWFSLTLSFDVLEFVG